MFNVGDIVAIEGFGEGQALEDGWIDFKAVVIEAGNPNGYPNPYLHPLSDRPDGYGKARFFWPVEGLVHSFEDVSMFEEN